MTYQPKCAYASVRHFTDQVGISQEERTYLLLPGMNANAYWSCCFFSFRMSHLSTLIFFFWAFELLVMILWNFSFLILHFLSMLCSFPCSALQLSVSTACESRIYRCTLLQLGCESLKQLNLFERCGGGGGRWQETDGNTTFLETVADL